jgi:hypothetical protein
MAVAVTSGRGESGVVGGAPTGGLMGKSLTSNWSRLTAVIRPGWSASPLSSRGSDFVREMKVLDRDSFASSSVPVHLLRGVVGLTLLVAAFALIPTVGPVALGLAPFGVFSLRGCPTCWAIGLAATLARSRADKACVDGGLPAGARRCRLTAAGVN